MCAYFDSNNDNYKGLSISTAYYILLSVIFRNAGGVIDGRKYSEHALERMVPDTVQVRAELTKRARERAERKGYAFGSDKYMEELKS